MYTGSGAKVPKQTADTTDGRGGEGRVKFEVSEKVKDSSHLTPSVRLVSVQIYQLKKQSKPLDTAL